MAFLSSCNKEERQREKDQEAIEEYINARGWETQQLESGLHFIVTEEGNGTFPNALSTVTVNYKGMLKDDTIFDQNDDISFPLTNVIPGWQQGIPKFSKGGSGILLIPSHLGYGTRGSGSVPPNAIMIFEVDLLDVD